MRDLLEMPPLKGDGRAPSGAPRGSEAEPRLRLRVAAERLSSSLAMLHACAAEAEGKLGLAICAARADRSDEALAMALSSRSGEADHPRALLVAGVAEHLRGHAAQVRLYLALASRLARSEIEYAPDLGLAQRLLLSTQMA